MLFHLLKKGEKDKDDEVEKEEPKLPANITASPDKGNPSKFCPKSGFLH